MLTESSSYSLQHRTGRPAPGEIVAHGASVHLEQMSHDQWSVGIEAGGKYFHLNFLKFAMSGGKLHVPLSDQGDEYAEWEGDNRERPFPGSSA